MQKFFQELQGKLWGQLIELFHEFVTFCTKTWQSIEPFRKNISDFFASVSNYWNKTSQLIHNSITFLYEQVRLLFISANQQYDSTKPIAVNLSKENKIGAWIIILLSVLTLIFWTWMIRHAKRNETEWKKTWIFIMIILGPIGAIAYYIFRKRKKEKSQDKHDKVMMSFFSPMHKNSKEIKE